ELRAAAARLYGELDIEREIFHGTEKVIPHLPEQFGNEWNEFKQVWESPLNHFAICEIDPDWHRDYEEHLKIYIGSVVPDDQVDEFVPECHDGPAAIRQALA